MRLFLLALSACLLTAPAMAQKFVSVTGESTRMTVGAIAAEAAATPAETTDTADTAEAATDGETPEVTGEDVAEAELAPEPETINFGDAVDTFIPDAGECNAGSLWNQSTGRCETF